MTEVQINEVTLRVTTVKLTKSLFKQMQVVTYDDIKHLLKSDGNEVQGAFIGWVHGSVIGDEWVKWMIVRLKEGQYGRYNAMEVTCQKYPQIYLS